MDSAVAFAPDLLRHVKTVPDADEFVARMDAVIAKAARKEVAP